MAPRCDGRPDTGICANSRSDDGHGWGVSHRSEQCGIRSSSLGRRRGSSHRADHDLHGGHHRFGQGRYKEVTCWVDDESNWLHDLRGRARSNRLCLRNLPPIDPRRFQSRLIPRCRLGYAWHERQREHAPLWGVARFNDHHLRDIHGRISSDYGYSAVLWILV
ncbi:unannotated protein [freshwater metagenome]|uniref:Unannotated protein n=1 Tax=freshwater metagenome TaxID=449393 RepID=A0A6J7PTU1_9ZZZZ